jgi:hypothetical protein
MGRGHHVVHAQGMKREALDHFRWMVEDGVKVNCVVLTFIVPVIGRGAWVGRFMGLCRKKGISCTLEPFFNYF